MRRSFEFGLDGTIFDGVWYKQSNRTNFRGGGPSSDFPAMFVWMPYKDLLFSNLVAMMSAKDITCMYLYQNDQGVDPDPGCPAQHVPRAYDSLYIAGAQFFGNPSTLIWSGQPIFNENSTFTGNHSDALLNAYTIPEEFPPLF